MRVMVIMAGGSGERFWPLSRKTRPKQFLPLAGECSMLEETVRRARSVPGVEQVCIVAGPHLEPGIRKMLPDLPPENLLVEPMGKNTAPCLAFAAAVIAKRWGAETVMGVLTADSLIHRVADFSRNADLAFDYSDRYPVLMTFGAPPTHPNTGFGYLEFGPVRESDARGKVHAISAFREKPDLPTAERYIAAGNYYWNTGMFFWRCSTLAAAFSACSPELARGMETIAQAAGTPFEADAVRAVFDQWPKISIDYAVMEKADNVCAIAGEFDWDDVGTWTALARIHPLDSDGNLVQGACVALDTRNSILYAKPVGGEGTTPLIATLGVDNLVIVVAEGTVLVCHRDRVQEIKRVLDDLRQGGRDEWL